jgi:hypothetical protein
MTMTGIFTRSVTVFAFLLMACWSVAFSQQERIISYHSDILVLEDGSFDVTETIKVYAAGSQIRRGIFRDFPTLYKGDNDEWYRAEFDVKNVLRNGQKETYRTERHYDGRRIYIGQEEVFLDEGEYTYTIRFRTDRLMRFFEDYDEVYWNVTGNYWSFPIEKSSATIVIPKGSSQFKGVNYCGPAGAERSCDVKVTANAERNEFHFENFTTLYAEEGLTVALAIDKGIVKPPSAMQQNNWFWYRDHMGILFAFLLLIFLIAIYAFLWYSVGRDPKRGTIIPLYEPPADMPPAAMQFLHDMGYKDSSLTAAVVSLAVKGYIKIEEVKGALWAKHFVLRKIKERDSALTGIEEQVMAKLLDGINEIEVKKENYTAFQGARVALTDFLKGGYKQYFKLNQGYVVLGFLLTIAAIASLFLFSTNDPAMNGLRIFALIGATVGGLILMIVLNALLKKSLHQQTIAFGLTWGTIVTILMLAGLLVYRSGSVSQSEFIIGPILILGHLAVQFIFMQLIKAPSVEGRKLMDKVEGFKMFLEIGEGSRMSMQNPPELTPELFEKYLPYAIALGVENKWAHAFEEKLKKIQQTSSGGSRPFFYNPTWYSGTSSFTSGAGGFNFGSFGGSIGSSFGSALGSSTSPPSSSGSGGFGGVGGGGFSGGGGGGGGGGGW